MNTTVLVLNHVLQDLELFGCMEDLDASSFERLTKQSKPSIQDHISFGAMDTMRQEVLTSADDMGNVDLSPESRKRIHVERTECYPVGDGEKTTLMFLKRTLNRVAIVDIEKAIAPKLLSPSLFLKKVNWEASSAYAQGSLVVHGGLLQIDRLKSVL